MSFYKPLTKEPSYEYDYLVCFQPRKKANSWVGRWFGHIVLWRNILNDSSVRIEPTLEGILIVPYVALVNDMLDDIAKDYRCYIYRTKTDNFKKRNYFVGFNSCVGITKRLLGLSKPFIWFPFQLEKFLEQEGTRYG
jgi:hypothetical protein